ncbi:15442_t:CDS:2, partial [Dentiscutata heterogama]
LVWDWLGYLLGIEVTFMPCTCLGAILVILTKPWVSVWGCLDYLICKALSAGLETILVPAWHYDSA